MYIYNSIFVLITFASNYKKTVYANARVFLKVYGRGGTFDIACSSDCRYQSFSIFSFYWKSWNHYRRVFIRLFEQMGMQKLNVPVAQW